MCGASNPPGVRVCVNYECRARFNVCKRCGTLNRFSARFCRSCGLTLPVLWDLEWPDLGGGTGHLGSSEDPLDFPLVAKWRWPRGDRERTERFVASAVVYKGLVYAASLGGSVFALDQYSGELRGESEAGSPISVTPVVADRELWLVTQGGDLCVMDGRVGGQAQESERLSDGPLSGCVVFDDVVVVASADGRIMAVKRGSISKTCWAWPRDGSRMAGGVPGGIAASGDVVVVATGSGE
ncbi:MAG: PQQ-binding-like beta-propeller repeat protein, partial [Armatimonadota bacterium]